MDTVLFDGDCVFCRASAERLRRLVGDRGLAWTSFREPGVLLRLPVSAAACERALQLVRNDGRVFAGAEAIAQLLARRALGKMALLYYLPGLRQLADWLYAVVARNRFRIAGRAGCESGRCGIHPPAPSGSEKRQPGE